MASKKSAKYPHQWPDGSWHSITYQQHQINKIQGKGLNPNPLNTPMAPNPAPTDFMAPAKGNAPGPSFVGELPQPFDPELANKQLGATWNVQLGDAEAKYQTGQTAYGTGYNADGSRNTANPYAQAQLLEDNWRRSITGTNNSMAAAGQYFSGARLNAQARNDRLYAVDSDTLQRGAADTYHGIGKNQLQTYAQNSLGVTGGAYDALKRSLYGS